MSESSEVGGDVIPFRMPSGRRVRSGRAVGDETGVVLLFTGVRYERDRSAATAAADARSLDTLAPSAAEA